MPADEICAQHGPYDPQMWLRRLNCRACELACDAHTARSNREEYRDKCLRSSGLVGWTKRATFDTFDAALPAQRSAVEACKAFVTTGGDTPMLLGPPGTGKTHLASAMVNHLICERGMSAAIHSAREIVKMLRAAWGKKHVDEEESESQVLKSLGYLRLLVIDEVGVGFGSESELVQLFDVIDLRYRLERPTVIVSNLPAGELKPAIGERAFDRLREGARVIPMNWPSHRGKQP